MSAQNAVEDASPLRNKLVDKIKQGLPTLSPEVEGAFRAVPRHVFVPEIPLEKAYSDQAILTQTIDGVATSSSSCPSLMAHMLQRLRLAPGHRVLEIGTGTGYNAALIGRLVGEGGRVTTIEVDAGIAEQARSRLREAGSSDVNVVTGNGMAGYAPDAPYDRIILTAASPTIFDGWWNQLAPDGRFVGPLCLRNAQFCMSFRPSGQEWISDSIVPVGFVLLRERGDNGERVGPAAEFRLAAGDSGVEAAQVAALLQAPTEVVETGLAGGTVDYFFLQLWLAIRNERSCSIGTLWGAGAGRRSFPCAIGNDEDAATFGLASASELCLVGPPAGQTIEQRSRCEICVYTYGSGNELLHELREEIAEWDRRGRGYKRQPTIIASRGPSPVVTGGTVHRVNAGDVSYVIDWI
jgi:protein-L-isoaspartate(D-aspartate) O-methyltransferase